MSKIKYPNLTQRDKRVIYAVLGVLCSKDDETLMGLGLGSITIDLMRFVYAKIRDNRE
jgi:hypothetical protein